jgi:glycosyltransferase involved in cell wall biosynthesis
LEAVKGLPFFLGAAQRVLAMNPNVQFLIAGAGPEEQNLRRLVRELDIVEAVTFVPNLYDFSTALEAMDIFCLPSLRQGLGTIMLDAMGRGIPVIATGVGGVFSVVSDNETGLVVPPSNSARLAERILELLADPLRARALGTKGRELVREEFSVERMVQETAELYREVVEEAKTQPPGKVKQPVKSQAT